MCVTTLFDPYISLSTLRKPRTIYIQTPKTILNSKSTMIVLIIFITLLILLLRTLQIAYFSPLSSFPNANFLAPLTPLWLFWTKARKREIWVRTALHDKFGPVVRLGPNELSINDAKGVKLVYGGGFEKTDFFQAFANFG